VIRRPETQAIDGSAGPETPTADGRQGPASPRPETRAVRLRINGAAVSVEADPATPLLSVLRGPLGLMGTRFGCGANQCGACHVLLGDRAVAACDLPLWSVGDEAITTVEGLGTPERPHPLQSAFVAEQAMQCGYCVSGILISAAALLRRNPRPTEAEVRAALDRNLCRCGAHNRMVRAVLRAAQADAAA
jgi:nicotinate dehydrogenase subunit A